MSTRACFILILSSRLFRGWTFLLISYLHLSNDLWTGSFTDGSRLARVSKLRHTLVGGHLHGKQAAAEDQERRRVEEVRARPSRLARRRQTFLGRAKDPEVSRVVHANGQARPGPRRRLDPLLQVRGAPRDG